MTEVLVRPDGHVAWATGTTHPRALRTERGQALARWISARGAS
nr:hypothetical protein [Streptomyces roseoverticillatus]